MSRRSCSLNRKIRLTIPFIPATYFIFVNIFFNLPLPTGFKSCKDYLSRWRSKEEQRSMKDLVEIELECVWFYSILDESRIVIRIYQCALRLHHGSVRGEGEVAEDGGHPCEKEAEWSHENGPRMKKVGEGTCLEKKHREYVKSCRLLFCELYIQIELNTNRLSINQMLWFVWTEYGVLHLIMLFLSSLVFISVLCWVMEARNSWSTVLLFAADAASITCLKSAILLLASSHLVK